MEGQYYRFSKDVVTQCIDSLYDNVIKKLPFTDLSTMKVHLRSDIQPGPELHSVTVQLRWKYQWPSCAVSSE